MPNVVANSFETAFRIPISVPTFLEWHLSGRKKIEAEQLHADEMELLAWNSVTRRYWASEVELLRESEVSYSCIVVPTKFRVDL